MEEIKKKVQEWWDSSPCCSNMAKAAPGTRRFYEEVDAYKDEYEPFTNHIADYASWNGKNVLEIGCGLGKDFSRFASAGAAAISIDMSIESLKLTKKRLEIFGLKGNLCLADAENLPFKDDVFDLVFSWGVLHHTPDTQKAVDELYRCLKPQKGKAIIMLYNKHSFYNFKIAIAGLKSILISTFGLKLLLSVKRLVLPWKWFKKSRTELTEWEKLNGAQLLAACSDGFGNPLSKVYSRRDALNMFSKFRNINIQAYESTNNRFIFKVSKAIERYFGWFMVIKAEK